LEYFPKSLSQAELNNLTRDLCLSKESSQLLGSRLWENHLLGPETTFGWYREREKEFRPFPRVSDAKLKAGVLDGPPIRELMQDAKFDKSLVNFQKFPYIINEKLSNHKNLVSMKETCCM
jgi:hypothetical protein